MVTRCARLLCLYLFTFPVLLIFTASHISVFFFLSNRKFEPWMQYFSPSSQTSAGSEFFFRKVDISGKKMTHDKPDYNLCSWNGQCPFSGNFQCLRKAIHCATSRKFAASIPYVVIGIFLDIILPAAL